MAAGSPGRAGAGLRWPRCVTPRRDRLGGGREFQGCLDGLQTLKALARAAAESACLGKSQVGGPQFTSWRPPGPVLRHSSGPISTRTPTRRNKSYRQNEKDHRRCQSRHPRISLAPAPAPLERSHRPGRYRLTRPEPPAGLPPMQRPGVSFPRALFADISGKSSPGRAAPWAATAAPAPAPRPRPVTACRRSSRPETAAGRSARRTGSLPGPVDIRGRARLVALPDACSGAMKLGVPTTAPVSVWPWPTSTCRARPKSITLGVMPFASITLLDFRSRWITPFSWA